MKFTKTIKSIAHDHYNPIAVEKNWTIVEPEDVIHVHFQCKIVDFASDHYDKSVKWSFEYMIWFEYKVFLQTIADYLPEDLAQNTHFVNWLKQNPDVLYQYAT